jgi:hypothetical protein
VGRTSRHRGDRGTRTPDFLLAKQALYQLSYIPMAPSNIEFPLSPRGVLPREHGGSHVLRCLEASRRLRGARLVTAPCSTLHLGLSTRVTQYRFGILGNWHIELTSSGWRSRCRPRDPHALNTMSWRINALAKQSASLVHLVIQLVALSFSSYCVGYCDLLLLELVFLCYKNCLET